MRTWKVTPIGKDTAEVLAPRARYVVQADKYSFTVRAFEGRRLVEHHYAKHVGHAYLLEGQDRRGHSSRLEWNLTRERIITRGSVNGRRFTLKSKPCVHAALLVKELRKRKRVRLPHTRAFAERLHEDPRFRKQIYRHVRLGRLLEQPNWVDTACALACTLCILVGHELSCLVCEACMDPGPILTA
ncbi:MAG: hypothetical protein WBW16_15225 [Bacteroidota bacterium]